jgi:hypothetical protein
MESSTEIINQTVTLYLITTSNTRCRIKYTACYIVAMQETDNNNDIVGDTRKIVLKRAVYENSPLICCNKNWQKEFAKLNTKVARNMDVKSCFYKQNPLLNIKSTGYTEKPKIFLELERP